MSRHKYPDGDFALAGANGAQGQSAAQNAVTQHQKR